MTRTKRAAASAAALSLLALPSAGQEFFGYWEDTASATPTKEIFVTPTGNDGSTNTGTAQSPFRSITRAVQEAEAHWNTGEECHTLSPITINVAPGTYDGIVETFPISLPAFGLTVEAWPDLVSPRTVRPEVVAPGTAAFQFDHFGFECLPPSVIQGLAIVESGLAVKIDPGSLPAAAPFAVEVRDNVIANCGSAIDIVVAPPHTATHVIEDNTILHYAAQPSFAIRESCHGASSTLYRSNRISFYEEGLMVTELGEGECIPRIFSNFVHVGERLVTLKDCDGVVVNNTIAFADDFSFTPYVAGLTLDGGVHFVSNNIIWNPLTPNGVLAHDVYELNFPIRSGPTNIIEDIDAPLGVVPGFVGGDGHPGSVWTDLHLLSTSQAIASGTNASVAHAANTVMSRTFVLGRVRLDVTVDNDLDGRIFRAAGEAGAVPTVDIGGDEFKAESVLGQSGVLDCRIDLVSLTGTAPNTQDDRGNVLAQPSTSSSLTWTVDLYLSGPPNGTWALLLGYGFHDTVVDPAVALSVPNTPIYQNTLLTPIGAGNLLLDPVHTIAPALIGTFDAAGRHTITGLPLATNNAGAQETEFHAQLMAIDAAGTRTALSNRKRLELNERP